MTPQQTEGQNPNIDQSIWDKTLHRIGGFFIDLVNEFLMSIQAVIPPNPTQKHSYEKSAVIVEIVQSDTSDYPAGVIKDACAMDRRAILRGVQTGRAWAAYDEFVIENGADGFGMVREACVANDASDQPLCDTPTSKYGDVYTAGGRFMATAAAYIPGRGTGEPSHLNGWIARQDAFPAGAAVFAVFKAGSNTEFTFKVDRDGNLSAFGRPLRLADVRLTDGSIAKALVLG